MTTTKLAERQIRAAQIREAAFRRSLRKASQAERDAAVMAIRNAQ